MKLSLFAALGLAVLVSSLLPSTVAAQSPVASAFMRNVTPGEAEPADGAAVVVVEGLTGAIDGCAPNVSSIIARTISALDGTDGYPPRPAITEMTPMWAPSLFPRCPGSPNPQDWKNIVLQIVVGVENGSANAASLWGGVMLDEEDTWFENAGGANPAYAASMFADINNSTALLLNSAPWANGVSWYYTESFVGQGDWDQTTFNNVTGYSEPAPQVATGFMGTLASGWQQGAPGRSVLVTWSLSYGWNFYQSQFVVTGAPYHKWGFDLSNCFPNGTACNDWDGDGRFNSGDNCISVQNPDQANTDATVVLPHPRFSFDDVTAIKSDTVGDACDDDIDNDGLSNGGLFANNDEANLGPGGSSHGLCPAATAATNAYAADTDGDLALDGAECAIGTDPVNPASKPTAAQCAAAIGVSTSQQSDGDGLADYIEYCYYGSDRFSANSDGDGCGDAREVASVNNDTNVSAADEGLVAAAFGQQGTPPYVADFDINKDGNITASDIGFVASKFGACP